jgi:hypothetical protein
MTPVLIPCSRSAHDQNVLARRPQWDQQGCHSKREKQAACKDHLRSLTAALLGTRRILGEEVVLAASGRAGEKYLPVGGRMRSLAFLSILLS